MTALRRRLSERLTDVYAWIDYRPDADFRPLIILPILAALGVAYAGTIGLGVILAVAILVTLGVASLMLVLMSGWIVANALLDVVPAFRLPSVPSWPTFRRHRPVKS